MYSVSSRQAPIFFLTPQPHPQPAPTIYRRGGGRGINCRRKKVTRRQTWRASAGGKSKDFSFGKWWSSYVLKIDDRDIRDMYWDGGESISHQLTIQYNIQDKLFESYLYGLASLDSRIQHSTRKILELSFQFKINLDSSLYLTSLALQ